MLKIAVWTKSPPKLEAIKEAIKDVSYFKDITIDIVSSSVDSWISSMPTSIEENMQLSKNRAINMKKKVDDADFYVWMEWWTSYIWDKTYLFGVVYILDRNWIWHFWFSNMVEVPDVFHKEIYINKKELWPVLSDITWIEWASKKNWVFWAWTDNIFTRKDQFIIAFLSAIPVFYNKYYKI